MRTILFLATFSLASFAAEQAYKIKKYPAQANGCHETAADLGARFQQATGIAPIRSRCLDEGAKGYQIEITYESEKALPLVSTYGPRGGITPLGRYASREACENAADNELKMFVEETELKPVVSFCTIDGVDSEKVIWFPRIDAFGQAKRTPQMGYYHYFAIPKGMTGTQIRDSIFAGLTAKGLRPVAVVFRSRMVYGEAAIHYYGPTREKFLMLEPTRTDTVEQCLGQHQELQAAFVGTANPPLVSYCGNPVIGSSEMNVLFVGPLTFVLRASAESFKSMAECEAQRPALIAYYKDKLKLPIRLGLCSRPTADAESKGYRVSLFEDKL